MADRRPDAARDVDTAPPLVATCVDLSLGIASLLAIASPLLTPTEIRTLQAARDILDVLPQDR